MGMCGEEKSDISNQRRIVRDKNKDDKNNDNIRNLIIGAESINSSISSNIDKQSKDRNRQKKRALTKHDKMPITSKSSIGRSINEQSNYLDSKNQSENIKNKKKKKNENKEYSQSENNQYLDNLGKEDNKKSFNIDKNIEDNKISQKIINKSDYIEEEDDKKISINEIKILEKEDNNIHDDDPNDNKKSQIITNNSTEKESNYSNFDINKNYYFGCPLCLNAPYIESIEYDTMKEDFLVTYICKCELKERSNPVNLSYLIIEKEPINSCQTHSYKELEYYCKTCEMKICIDCYKEEHNNHEINNNYLMTEENGKKFVKMLDNYKENFKGYDILVKTYNEYIKQRSCNIIEELKDNLNIINGNDSSNKINNDKVENDSKNLNESYNDNPIEVSKNIFESGIQTEIKINQNINNQNFNIENSNLIQIINQQSNNNNQNLNLNTSTKDNNNINNINKDESLNIGFNIFNENISENSKQIKALNDIYEKPKNNSLSSVKEKINESKNISFNKENNIINQEQDKLKHYYNCKTLKGHKERVISLIQLESGNLVSGSRDSSIIIWDLYKCQIISEFYEFGQVLCLLEFEPNKLLAGTSENNIGLWDLNKLEDSSSFNFLRHSLWVNSLVKIDKNTFASASNDCNIYVWDYYNRKFLFELTGHTDCILTLIKLNDGRLCSGSADLTIKIWNLKNRECEQELIGHNNWIFSLYQLKNGNLLSSDVNSLIIWKNFSLYKSINSRCEYRSLLQIDDNCLAGTTKDNVIDLLDLNNYQIYDTLKGHYSNVICVIKLKDNRLASCSLDKTIKIWEQKL